MPSCLQLSMDGLQCRHHQLQRASCASLGRQHLHPRWQGQGVSQKHRVRRYQNTAHPNVSHPFMIPHRPRGARMHARRAPGKIAPSP